jgi:predicted ribosome quality control (RQC) complex YloA/Tae2 family protein
MNRMHFSTPTCIKAIRRKVDTLERQVDAAFERGDLEVAEELDAQLAELRERLTSAAESLVEDEESFEDEAGLEEQLVEAYHAYQQMKNGKAFGPFNDRAGAIANMRDAIVSASGTARH